MKPKTETYFVINSEGKKISVSIPARENESKIGLTRRINREAGLQDVKAKLAGLIGSKDLPVFDYLATFKFYDLGYDPAVADAISRGTVIGLDLGNQNILVGLRYEN